MFTTTQLTLQVLNTMLGSSTFLRETNSLRASWRSTLTLKSPPWSTRRDPTVPSSFEHWKSNRQGKPISIFESGSILLYLAEKYGKLIPKDPAKRVECFNWLFFQVGAAPYFGQYGHFTKYASEKIPYAINRYTSPLRGISHLDTRWRPKDSWTSWTNISKERPTS